MHPIRPLEAEDHQLLLELAEKLPQIAPSLNWEPLKIGLRRLKKGNILYDITIPEYWAEETPIFNNLPTAEFDETGFIGRNQERKSLRKFIESEHRVISVVGEAGIGKTALALRVCNDLLEENTQGFDKIIWVSLKTKYLTAQGVKEITNAVDSVELMLYALYKELDIVQEEELTGNIWQSVIKQMTNSRILLVIDNLETIGLELRDLALTVPQGSKLLFTSRVGLGEIEVRYEIPQYATKDAILLFKSLASLHNYQSLRDLGIMTIQKYCRALQNSPLLIKWFVHAVGLGADPSQLLSKKGLEEPLKFCYSSIYNSLGKLEQKLLSILLAARRELTNAQLIELAGAAQVAYVKAVQNLIISSMIERILKPDGTMVFQVRGLVYEFLSANYPPENEFVKEIRATIKNWQLEQENSALQNELYRYGLAVIHIDNEDERIAAQHLIRARQAIYSEEWDKASQEILDAERITPTWWEIFRIKALMLQRHNRPIYEVEEAYEESIKYNDNDVNRYHYAAYLFSIQEYERVIIQCDCAMKNPQADARILQSLKGLSLMRMGKVDEALPDLQSVWDARSNNLPTRIGRTQGTQLLEAYRRTMDQHLSRGNIKEVVETFVKAAEVIKQIFENFLCDHQLAGSIIRTIYLVIYIENQPELKTSLDKLTKLFDKDYRFTRCVIASYQATTAFQRNEKLRRLFPNTTKAIGTSEFELRYEGTILRIIRDFGFIDTKQFGEVHFSRSSLEDQELWNQLQTGNRVGFQVLPLTKGRLRHAVRLVVIHNTE